MNPILLIIVPLVGAAFAAVWPDNRTRPWLLPVFGLLHVGLTFCLFFNPPVVAPTAWLGFDPLARAVLPAVSVLFLVCAAYGVPYLRIRSNRPNRVFIALLLAILGLLSAGHQARHLVLLWIATEAVTLAAVPLLHFNGTPRAFEATWKYLLVGGTGIALSLLGSFCLGYASLHGGGAGDLTFSALTAQGAGLSRPWLLTAWVLLLVGYGTKMGLAPMHTWKPDAYGEAPSIVGAVLAGGVTTVAFTAILRVRSVIGAAGEGAIADRTLLVIGLFSILVAALFLLGTRNFKRMLAYSSVEHMGILCIGAAFGGAGVAAALFHVWSNGLTKGALFLSAGNIRRAADSPSMDDVRGMSLLTPRSAAIFVTGMFAVTALPPFGPFFSELQVVRAGLASGHDRAITIFLGCLLLAFVGLTRVVFGIVDGRPRPTTRTNTQRFVETAGVIVPPLVLLGLSLWLGLFTPPILREAWSAAVAQLFSNSMSASTTFALLANGTSRPWAVIPAWPVQEFVRATASELTRGARLCAWFGVPEGAETRLVAVLAFDADNTLAVARSVPFAGAYPSLTTTHPQAHLFEREVWEQHGVTPKGHPWLKPVRKTNANGNAPANGEFFRVDGREVHEVAVGPVHAGIIEPGHFRFQCAGEEVLHLEIALGYQHRGVEEALTGGPHLATMSQMETVAGDTTIAHATAHATLMESLAGTEAPLRAQWLRAIALELERLANHSGDMGALANDVAFLPTSSACGKIRGDYLNLTALICGNRFGRGLVRPGGCRHDLEPERAAQLIERLKTALADTEQAIAWFWDAASVRARFENVGTVFPAQAREIGMVGPAARACGLVRDVRYDHPTGWHRFAQAPVAVWPGGDVFARARVRSLEIQRSGQYLCEQLAGPADGELRSELAPPAPDTFAVALVEGWRGEVCHVALTDAAGRFRRYKIIDPSFHNWTGLALALRGTAISDFPICNKSFNLSYCGFDL